MSARTLMPTQRLVINFGQALSDEQKIALRGNAKKADFVISDWGEEGQTLPQMMHTITHLMDGLTDELPWYVIIVLPDGFKEPLEVAIRLGWTVVVAPESHLPRFFD